MMKRVLLTMHCMQRKEKSPAHNALHARQKVGRQIWRRVSCSQCTACLSKSGWANMKKRVLLRMHCMLIKKWVGKYDENILSYVHLNFWLSLHLSLWQSVHLSFCTSAILNICTSLFIFFLSMSVCLLVYMSIISVHLSFFQSVLLVCLPVLVFCLYNSTLHTLFLTHSLPHSL